MRWVLFAIMLYVVIATQTAVAPFLAVQTIRPDLPLLFAVHLALAAPPADARLAAVIIGLAVDLNGLGFAAHTNVGANALAYGLIAELIVRIRGLTFRDHALTYFVFVFGAATAVHALVGMHLLYVSGQSAVWADSLGLALGAGVYTAVVSPYAHWLLRRTRGWLGLGPVATLRVR